MTAGTRCLVAPHPDIADQIRSDFDRLRDAQPTALAGLMELGRPRRLGFDDGMIMEPEDVGLEASPSVLRDLAQQRQLRGAINVAVVLVDFSDKPMTATKQRFEELFFSTGVLPFGSVNEYFKEVSGDLISITGTVAGPFRMPKTLAQYAHGESGIGDALPNARTMARDALAAAASSFNFTSFDNDGNGYVDAFIVIHAGRAGEETNSANDIWSHKWVLDGGAQTKNGKKIYAYLTVPEDCRIGVCAHELGHLLFGWPDLYDTDYSSNGIGNWCLMAGGSWNGRGIASAQPGDVPAAPSAWCRANQGWVNVDVRKTNGAVHVKDFTRSKSVLRLWKNGDAASKEYFLVENRQQNGYDRGLPGNGLLIWHVDDTLDKNSDESHYKVALVQADNQKHLEQRRNRGDGGDPYPGTANNRAFTPNSAPPSKSHSGLDTLVSVTSIPASNSSMQITVNINGKNKQRPAGRLAISRGPKPAPRKRKPAPRRPRA